MKNLDKVNGVERIGVPSGENSEPYWRAFEAVTGIEIPFTRDRKLSATSQGIQFYLFKSTDMPANVEDGLVDLGITGSDTMLDRVSNKGISWQRIGDAVCRFSILANPETKEKIETLIARPPRFSLFELPTSFPVMLNSVASFYELSFKAMDRKIEGCVETYAKATGIGAVADIVQTGETARANDLEEVYKLIDVGGATVWRDQDESL